MIKVDILDSQRDSFPWLRGEAAFMASYTVYGKTGKMQRGAKRRLSLPCAAFRYRTLRFGEQSLAVILQMTEQKSRCVTLPAAIDGVPLVGIGDGAFRTPEAHLLRKVVLPSSVEVIGDNAFDGCGHLCSVSFPAALRSIGDHAFVGCLSLRRLQFAGEGLERIGEGAFLGCTALLRVDLSPGVREIGDGAFSLCTALQAVTLPRNLLRIGVNAFRGCTALRATYIPDGVTEIGAGAFADCSALEEIRLPATLKRTPADLFRGCTALHRVYVPTGSPAEAAVAPLVPPQLLFYTV